MISRRTLLSLCPAWLLLFLPGVKASQPKTEPTGPARYYPTEAFWSYLKMSRPAVYTFLRNWSDSHLFKDWYFECRTIGKRFLLTLPLDIASVPPAVKLQLDRQVDNDYLAMVFAGTPRIFEAGPQHRIDINFDVGDVFCTNPYVFDQTLPNKMMACRITKREAFMVWLLFSDGTTLNKMDVDDIRAWG